MSAPTVAGVPQPPWLRPPEPALEGGAAREPMEVSPDSDSREGERANAGRPVSAGLPMQGSSLADSSALRARFDLIEQGDASTHEWQAVMAEILEALEAGTLRVAEPRADASGWVVHGWVKRALLAIGGAGVVTEVAGPLPGTELSTLGWRMTRSPETRVPPGSSVRRGCYLAAGVSMMPPSTVQAGAWIGSGTQVDSHALIGSCAQIAEQVFVGPGTIVSGIILPESALPVIVERDVVLGGGCGLYGSLWVGEGALLRPGTVLHAADGLYDAVGGSWIEPGPDLCLRVPAGAEIAMGLPPPEHARPGPLRVGPLIIGLRSRS